RVDRVGLALGAPGPAVRPVHLDHGDARVGEVAGEFGAVGAGALHAHGRQLAVRGEEGVQAPVAGRGGGELVVGQVPAEPVDHRGVMGAAVGVHAGDD